MKEKVKQISIYVTNDIIQAVKVLADNSPIRERKNSIILRCLISGLKTEYGIDLSKKNKIEL